MKRNPLAQIVFGLVLAANGLMCQLSETGAYVDDPQTLFPRIVKKFRAKGQPTRHLWMLP